jgi:signal transduction histidine kinase
LNGGGAATPGLDAESSLVHGLFPFCFTLGPDLRLAMVGSRWEQLAPEVRVGAAFLELFEIERPLGAESYEAIESRANHVFLISLRARPELKLRGQFVPRPGCACTGSLLFVGGPWLIRIADMTRLGLGINDFPPHDPRGDFLVLLQTQESTMGDLKALAARLRSTGAALEARTREMEREMQLREQLEAQLRQSQKMEAIGRLAGGVAHDFNNILMAIHGYAALSLSRVSPSDPVRGWVEQIRSAADRAAALTRQLLTFSRQHVLRPRAIDLAREVHEVEKLLRPLIGERIALSIACDPGIGFVYADPSAIQQIVMNLAVNARDAMPDGGQLEISLTRRGSDGASSLGEVILSVRDTGVGMTDEVKARLFEPFFTTKEVGKGSGLGLSIVYGLVEQCGGRVEVESTLGVGSTLRVLLPMVAPPAAEPAAPVSAPSGGRGERVLLVEDEPLVRRLLEQLLGRAGYQVSAHADASQAFAAIGRPQSFDLLVTDVVMAGMTGPELSRRIESEIGPMPTVFMSGHNEDDMFRRGELPPHHRFMPKPFSPNEFLEVAHELIASAPRKR